MNSFYTVVAVIFCLGAASAATIRSMNVGTPFKNCGSTGGTITDVNVAGCDALPCQFKRGTNVTFSMDFKATQDISTATVQVYAFLGPIKVPFSPSDNNACHFMTCPIKNEDSVTFKQSLPILSSYPPVSATVEWQLVSSGKVLTCFALSAHLS